LLPSFEAKEPRQQADHRVGVGAEGAEAAPPSQGSASELPRFIERFERFLAKEARQQQLEGVFRGWREACTRRRTEDSHKEGKAWVDRITMSFEMQRETVSRLHKQRRDRCENALRAWQEVQRQLLISNVVSAWSAAVEHTRVSARELAHLSQEEEVQKLRSELESSRAAKETAEALVAQHSSVAAEIEVKAAAASAEAAAARAEAASLRATAEETSAELLTARSQLNEAERNLSVAEAKVAAVQEACNTALAQQADAEKQLLRFREASSPETASESNRLLTDLTIKLAQAEADTAEAKSQASKSNAEMQHLQSAFADARCELEVVYSLLSNSEVVHQDAMRHLKGTIRDRELGMAHLRHLLERLREPPVPVKEDEDLKRKLTADTPSASTPGIQSCLSLPSLSSVSSPQSVRTVKSKATPKEIEDRKKRWSANWH